MAAAAGEALVAAVLGVLPPEERNQNVREEDEAGREVHTQMAKPTKRMTVHQQLTVRLGLVDEVEPPEVDIPP